MTIPAAATRHVVERCPRCGVEHEGPTRGACEACDTPLRLWCGRHGREAGWLDGPSCPRCAEEAARPPRPAPARAPVLDSVAPAAVPVQVEAAPAEVAVDAARPARQPEGGVMFMILFFTVAAGAFGGMVLSTPFVFGSEIHLDTLVKFLVGGGMLGLLFGVYSCRLYVHELRAKARKR